VEICLSRIARFRTPPWAFALLSPVLVCLIGATATAAGPTDISAPQQSDPPQEKPVEPDTESRDTGGADPNETSPAGGSGAEETPPEEPAVAAHEATAEAKPKRLQFSGDARLRLNSSTTSDEEANIIDNGEIRLRLRLGLAWVISKTIDFKIRAAGSASSDGNLWDFEFDTAPSTRAGLVPGEATFDELYFKWAPGRRFNLYAGRFQSQFQLLGVFPKSLDKKDSNNMRITWSDGLHLFYRGKTGWSSHLIAEYQDPDGPTTILRAPLDFHDEDARVSYFFNVRSDRRLGPLVQRALDISYFPAALLKDGVQFGRRVDYWAALTRWSLEWHIGEGTKSIIAGAEIGYAPETPIELAVGIPGIEDTDGYAWQTQVSLMNFKPGHSIGLNVGVADAGWLISPQFRNNEKLAEIRYRKLMRRGGLLEVRVRYREQIDAEIDDPTRDGEWDGYARFTRSF
jgi:hypothetical protein